MKPTPFYFCLAATVIFVSVTGNAVNAQQYKLRQVNTISGMKVESTIYVKGMRKRTEGAGFMGMGANLVTIEQCDLQRTVKLNDKKKLYFIEPFSKVNEEIIDEDARPAPAKARPVTQAPQAKEKKGGVITMWYNITDTGERKKMYGFTARHIWTTQKIKPSPDACMMKDSMVMKTDGWYIDLPQFNCPVTGMARTAGPADGGYKPDCQDRFVSRRSGKGKLGFPLVETRIMIMGTQSSQFETTTETLELSTVKLDSMLFEIPPGYQMAKSEEELQEKMDISEMMKQGGYDNMKNANQGKPVSEQKSSGMIRVGVAAPTGEESLQASTLQEHLVGLMTTGNIEALAISSEADAKKFKCDYILTTTFTRVKQASKVGSLLKAIKNTDPTASSSFNIEGTLKLSKTSDGSTHSEEKFDGKFDGKADDAAKKALEKGSREIIRDLN